MSGMPITTLVAGVFAILIVWLSAQVSLRRFQINAIFGDAGDSVLRRRIRAHGNFIEYAPLALIVLGLAEYHAAPPWLVGVLAAAFGASRVLHAVGMLYMSSATMRGIAMLLNHASFVVAGVWLLMRFLRQQATLQTGKEQ